MTTNETTDPMEHLQELVRRVDTIHINGQETPLADCKPIDAAARSILLHYPARNIYFIVDYLRGKVIAANASLQAIQNAFVMHNASLEDDQDIPDPA